MAMHQRALVGLIAIFVCLLPVPNSVASSAAGALDLDNGYRQMYDLNFSGAHQTFAQWETQHPDDPLVRYRTRPLICLPSSIDSRSWSLICSRRTRNSNLVLSFRRNRTSEPRLTTNFRKPIESLRHNSAGIRTMRTLCLLRCWRMGCEAITPH